MGKFSIMPADVLPLVACVTAGGLFLLHSAYRTTFHCGEVHLTNRTRADELQEDTHTAEEKSKVYYKNSLYMQFGKMFSPGADAGMSGLSYEPDFCKPKEKMVEGAADPRRGYGASIAQCLYKSLCLRDFPCQEVERHSKPEVEAATCPELLLPPCTICCATSGDQCLIEPSINATRVSFKFRILGAESDLDIVLSQSYFKFLQVKADMLPVLRRATVENYDVSFLVTASLLQQYGMTSVIVSLVMFALHTPGYVQKLRHVTDSQNEAMAKQSIRVFGKRSAS